MKVHQVEVCVYRCGTLTRSEMTGRWLKMSRNRQVRYAGRERVPIFGRGPWALAASGTDTSTFEVIYLSTRLEGVQQLHGPLENLLCGNQLGRPARLQGQLFCDRIRKTD